MIDVLPPLKYRTAIKTSPLFTAIFLVSKRKFSLFKSPLTKIKIPKSPALRKSPMTKRLKVTTARANSTVKDDFSRIPQSIEKETFAVIDSKYSSKDWCGSDQDNFSVIISGQYWH